MSPSARRALFTELGSGNTAATSGSRTTMIVSFANRLAYFPRTPPEKSYSGSIWSASGLDRTFFILSPFTSGCRSRADDSNRLSHFRMYHDHGSILIGSSNGQESSFLDQMEQVPDRNGEGVSKHRRRLSKGDAVLQQVRASFSGCQRTTAPCHVIVPYLRANDRALRRGLLLAVACSALLGAS